MSVLVVMLVMEKGEKLDFAIKFIHMRASASSRISTANHDISKSSKVP